MKKYFDFTLISFGEFHLKFHHIFTLFLIFITAFIIQLFVRKLIFRMKRVEKSKRYTIYKLFQYFFWLAVLIYSLQSLGINISLLLAGSAALLVGFGLGMQHIFGDFVSGIILLLDGSLKVGDVIELNNMICVVKEINFRTTTVMGRNENYIIVPNSELTRYQVVNWTHSRVSSRFKVTVRVEYGANINLVMQLLKEAAQKHPMVLKNHQCFAWLEEYGESALIFSVYFWSDEVFLIEKVRSDIRVSIYNAFREHNLHIPFPQRTLHIKKED